VIYLSYKQLPELRHLSPLDRRTAWVNFIVTSPGAGRAYAWLIIVGMLAGLAMGAFVPSQPSEGPVIGGMLLGALLPPLLSRLVHLQRCRSALKTFVSASSHAFVPVSDRSATIIRFGKETAPDLTRR
jgi:hypothetical protein